MPTTIRKKVAVGGVVAAFAALSFASGSLFAQTATLAPSGTLMAGDMGMMGAASPEAGGTQAAAEMEQCMEMMEMMEMMQGMMGGDMSGMMAGQGMAGGGDEPSATPASGQ